MRSTQREIEIEIRLVEKKIQFTLPKGKKEKLTNVTDDAVLPTYSHDSNNTKFRTENVTQTVILDEQIILVQGEASFEFAPIQSETKTLFVEVCIQKVFHGV